MFICHEKPLASRFLRLPVAWSVLAVAATLCLHGHALAATASASSGGGFAGDQDDDSSWFFPIGATRANITWAVPTYTVDATSPPTPGIPFTEPKFPSLAGTRFTGFDITDFGPKGSVVHAAGGGISTGTISSTIFRASWYVVATGLAAPGGGDFAVKATGKDPWDILNSDVSRFSGGTVDLYIPFSMTGGSFDATKAASSFGFSLSFEGSSGDEGILGVQVDKLGVTVDGPSALLGDVKFYVSPGDDYLNPVSGSTPGQLVSLSELKSLIEANVVNGSFAHAINIGVVVADVAVPDLAASSALNSGIFGKIHADAVAAELDATPPVPEPDGIALVLSGLGVFVGWRRARRVPHRVD